MTDQADALAFMFAPRVFIRVYRLPKKLTNGYCFGGGNPIIFTNVDWFEIPITDSRENLIRFLQKKMYIKDGVQYLVLSDEERFTFQFTGQRDNTAGTVR